MLTNTFRILFARSMDMGYTSGNNISHTGESSRWPIKNIAKITRYSTPSDMPKGLLGKYMYIKSDTDSSGYPTGDGVMFGNGTATPTPDDTFLSGECLNKLLGQTSTTSVTQGTDGHIDHTVTYMLTNNSTTDITISEIGYAVSTPAYTSSEINNFQTHTERFLIDHTLLDEPVTIPAGGVGQVTYTITFNLG